MVVKSGIERQIQVIRHLLENGNEPEKLKAKKLRQIQAIETFTRKKLIFSAQKLLAKDEVFTGQEDLKKMLEEEGKKQWNQYPLLIDKAFKKARISICERSQFPHLKLENGLIEIKFRHEPQLAIFYSSAGKIGECIADIPLVIAKIQKEKERLFPTRFSGRKFLRKLFEKYQKVQEKGMGNLRDIFKQLQEDDSTYRIDRFSSDLARLVKSGPLSIAGRSFSFQQTRDSSAGIILPGSEQYGYISTITFTEAKYE